MDKPTTQVQQQQQQPAQQHPTKPPPPHHQPNSQQQQQHPHVLFDYPPTQTWDEIDDRIHNSYQNLKQITTGKSPKDCHDVSTKYMASNPPKSLEDFNYGLLVAILVEPDGQQDKYYRDAVTLNKDGMSCFSNCLCFVVAERLPRLKDHSIKQTFWAANQLMKAGIAGADNVCIGLMRSIQGGDLSPRNLWLAESLIDLLIENRQWLVSTSSFVVPIVIYSFMRILADHMLTAQTTLRQKETDFVIGLIREKFLDCIQIGRDFLRVLYHIIKIPEFEKLWHDIFNDPKSLHPTFLNPMQMLAVRSPRRLFSYRLTVEMERRLSYLAQNVRFGKQKSYQDSFHRQFLATPESQTLRSDLIRYICTVIHPTNEVLCSDIIPRWAVIGWLLTTCTTSASSMSSRLALLFDWIIYDVKSDNIMNIEPGILVMYYSMRSHPNVTLSLLDFLCRLPTSFAPKLSDNIRAGIKTSLNQILEKRVIPSLSPLFDNPKHDITLRSLLRDNFPEFCSNSAAQPTDNEISSPTNASQVSLNQVNHQANPSSQSNHTNLSAGNTVIKEETTTSDEKSPEVMPNQSNAPLNTTMNNQSQRPVMADNPNHNSTKLGNSSLPQSSSTMDEKASQSTVSASSTLTSPMMANLDTTKAFTWNGTENANASYSTKQNHDKNRKSSISINSTNPVTAASPSLTSPTLNSSSPLEIARRQAIDAKLESASLDPEKIDLTKDFDSSNSIGSPSTVICDDDESSLIRVVYPFMTVKSFDLASALSSLTIDGFDKLIENLDQNTDKESRVWIMRDLMSKLYEIDEPTPDMLDDLGRLVARCIVHDFTTKIFPQAASFASTSSQSQITSSLEESLESPLFILCRDAFSPRDKFSQVAKTISLPLLASVSKHFEATNFLVLYYCQASLYPETRSFSSKYVEFCNAAKRDTNRCLYDDLFMCLTYDPAMFCFLLPGVFGELASYGLFPVTGNIELIHLAVSALDPATLQELICLCLPGTAKIINTKEDVTQIIEKSLNWESWEQYCFWKLVAAQGVPIEKYISILPKLNSKAHPEALSCVLLSLQRVTEPSIELLEHLIDFDSSKGDKFTSSILRYWTIRSDVKQLAKMIAQLFDSHPSSPQVKRKGQPKSKNSTNLSQRSERLLGHLDAVRKRAPKSKLLTQTEIITMLSKMEQICNEEQRERYNEMLSYGQRPTKKQKLQQN